MEESLFDKFSDEGFIKTCDAPNETIASDQKAALNRKGNMLFNAGDIESARRIFQTTAYSDGLIRVGDLYYKSNKYVDALKMYKLAHDTKKTESLIEKMAVVIQNLLKEEDTNERSNAKLESSSGD